MSGRHAAVGIIGRLRNTAGLASGGKVDTLSGTTNVIPFPLSRRGGRSAADARNGPETYEFSERELGALCRWFSAMKYAFPGTEGVMIVSHQECYSAVGLYNGVGGAPNCLLAKHDVGGQAQFFWSTEGDPPRQIDNVFEIIDAHIRAIQPPRDEKGWLDPAGWMGVYAARVIAAAVQVI